MGTFSSRGLKPQDTSIKLERLQCVLRNGVEMACNVNGLVMGRRELYVSHYYGIGKRALHYNSFPGVIGV